MTASERTLDDRLYFYGVIAFIAFAVFGAVLLTLDYNGVTLPYCLFNKITGLYCPGCGGTRSVRALLHGHLIKSLWYHPFVFYGAVMYAIYMITNTIKRYINHNFYGMKYKDIYIYIWIAILFLNVIIRNIMLVKFNISLDYFK